MVHFHCMTVPAQSFMSDTVDNSDTLQHSDELQKKVRTLPASPGIYQFRNASGSVIYVGKAKNLRSRVRSYFGNNTALSEKTRVLVNRITDVDVIMTSSEVEALILENNLIKELKPRYNINLKDDKTYPFLVITREPFPRLMITRQIKKNGDIFFGPYTEAGQLRSVLELISSVFQIRSCKLKLSDDTIRQKKFTVCLDYHIYKCKGPCEGFQTREAYNSMISEVILLLKGRTSGLVRSLTEQMHRDAEQLRFEEAAELKTQINGLKKYAERQKVATTDTVDRDVFGIAQEGDNACGIVFKIREGKLLGSQRMYFSNTEEELPEILLAKFLEKYYLETPDIIPREICTSHVLAEDEQEALQKLLCTRPENAGRTSGKVRFISPKRGEKAALLEMCEENARHLLREYLIEKQKRGELARQHPALTALAKFLRLQNLPRRIECFDNSHFQGSDYTASMVCFVNGKPKKSDYRRFRLKSFEGSDDYAAMREVLTRRYSGNLSDILPKPDLIVVDGGKGQVNTAAKVLAEAGLSMPVIGLAKRLEEIYLPEESDPFNLPKTSPALKLLQNLRDEAHRFAVTYHRSLRTSRTVTTSLTGIPGIGEKTAMLLLQTFGSTEQIAKASLEALKQAVGPKTAQAIHNHFQKAPKKH